MKLALIGKLSKDGKPNGTTDHLNASYPRLQVVVFILHHQAVFLTRCVSWPSVEYYYPLMEQWTILSLGESQVEK